MSNSIILFKVSETPPEVSYWLTTSARSQTRSNSEMHWYAEETSFLESWGQVLIHSPRKECNLKCICMFKRVRRLARASDYSERCLVGGKPYLRVFKKVDVDWRTENREKYFWKCSVRRIFYDGLFDVI